MRAIVTGAAGGLGRDVARRLAADSHQILLLDRDERVHALAAQLQPAAEGAVLAVTADVSDEQAAEQAVALAAQQFGGVDALVHLAGIGGPATEIVDTTLADFRHVLEVNLVGTFVMARAVARRLVRQGTGGSLVHVGSVFGEQAVGGGAGYCAAKGGLRQLTQSLALELASHRIRVNTVAPGNMATEMHWDELRARAARHGTTFETERERAVAGIPWGRFGTGDDVGGAVAWLISPDADYVTGQSVAVNGGIWLS